jgi:hypothetical protein
MRRWASERRWTPREKQDRGRTRVDGGASKDTRRRGASGGTRKKHSFLDFTLQVLFLLLMNDAYDELPGVSVSKLRALGDITEAMKVATVKLGEYEFTVGLSLFRWPNGGSWSFFVCPCGRRARIIRLFEGGLACSRCLMARGLQARVELVRTERRAAWLTPKRLERLKSDSPARLHPRPGRMLDRRANMEFALRRSLIVARKHGVVRAKDQGF